MSNLLTRITLLQRLKSDGREDDWSAFYEQYWAVILSFAMKRGLDHHGARDVLQETMVTIMQKLSGFDYQPERGRFRNWILTIVANKVRSAQRRSWRHQSVSLDESSSDQGPALIDQIAAEGTGGAEAVEISWRLSLLEEALRRIAADPRTKPESIAVFRAVACEERPVAEVAREFGMTENGIHQIKNRLMTRLRGVVAALENGESADEAEAESPSAPGRRPGKS